MSDDFFIVPDERQYINLNLLINHFETKYQFVFYRPLFSEIPNLSAFNNDKDIKRINNYVQNQLLNTFPIYMGTNDSHEIKVLKMSFSNFEHTWFRDHNKLGFNRFVTILNALYILRKKTHVDFDFYHLDMKRYANYSEKYVELTFEEKCKFSKDYETEIYKYLETLYSSKFDDLEYEEF